MVPGGGPSSGRPRPSRTRTVIAVAAAVGGLVVGLAAAARTAAAAQLPQPFPATLPVACDNSPRVRKEVGALTPAEWAAYQRAVVGLHERETSGSRATLDWFERFIQMHGAYQGSSHAGAHFLAWHRLFLLAYENALRTVEPTVTVPYWDWSMDSADPALSPVWQAGRLGGAKDGSAIQGGAFNRFFVDTNSGHLVQRGFDSGVPFSMGREITGFIPDKAMMRAMWSEPSFNFSTFTRALESEHGLVHVAIGGTGGDMMSLHKAAGDVAFWSHHAYVDFVWAQRQKVFPQETYTGLQNGVPISPDDDMSPFATKARYAIELKCVTHMVDPRETRPKPIPKAASAWLPCKTDAECGCGSCVKNACQIGTAERTKTKCGGVSVCIRHPNPTKRRLICRCTDRAKCECTRSADCGCGYCKRSKGECCAARRLRLVSYCGPRSQCVRSPSVVKFRCAGGIACRRHADCGCGRCYRRRCVVRRRQTRRMCGTQHQCVALGATLRCRRKPVARFLVQAMAEPMPPQTARPAVNGSAAAAPSAQSEAEIERYEQQALVKFKATMSEAVKKESKLRADAEMDAKIALAEADADSDAVASLAMEAEQAKSKTSSRLAYVVRQSYLRLVARVVTHKLTPVEIKVNKQAHETRMEARKELLQAEKESRRRLRNIALEGFSLVNGLDPKTFLAADESVEMLQNKAGAKSEAAANAGAEKDEDAENEQ